MPAEGRAGHHGLGRRSRGDRGPAEQRQAHDYDTPDPDLPPLEVDREWVEELRSRLPELPDARSERLVRQYRHPYDAALLTEERALADYYEDAVAAAGDAGLAKPVANLITGPMFRLMNQARATIEAGQGAAGAVGRTGSLGGSGRGEPHHRPAGARGHVQPRVSASVVIRREGPRSDH